MVRRKNHKVTRANDRKGNAKRRRLLRKLYLRQKLSRKYLATAQEPFAELVDFFSGVEQGGTVNQTGLIVVGNTPIPSVYEMAKNGLYMPAQSHYPEFQQAIVQQLNNVAKPYIQLSQVDKPVYQTSYYGKLQVYQQQQLKYMAQGLKYYGKNPNWKLSRLVPGLEERYPIQRCPDPLCDVTGFPVFTRIADAIVHLNDSHHWSREKIANWLDTLENIDLRVKKAA